MSTAFLQGAKVRFTQERLSVLSSRDRNGLAGRIGVVQTDGAHVNKPTVYFPADGSRPDIRLFRVDPRQLELVENPPEPAVAPVAPVAPAPQPAAAQPSTVEAPATEGGGNLSQDELDNFFN